jgi:hypothetical protein
MNEFVKELKQYRHLLSKQTISTIKGMALTGDIIGAEKMLKNALDRKQNKSEIFINAHRSSRYMTKNYDDIDYKAQFILGLRGDSDG